MPKITLPGVALEDVPKSTVAIIAVLLTLSGIGLIWWGQVRNPELQLVTAREATETAMAEIEEFGKHIGEKSVSEYTLSESPLILARLYKDRCVLLVSDTPEGVRSKLVRDLARDTHRPKKSGSMFDIGVLAAPLGASRCDAFMHPPPFRTQYGVKQGCWVPVWRVYYDGCTHVQMFDGCHGTWDGRINWTVCKH